eukprot:1159145-Pelagomonas_calceolata.AAC.34
MVNCFGGPRSPETCAVRMASAQWASSLCQETAHGWMLLKDSSLFLTLLPSLPILSLSRHRKALPAMCSCCWVC